MFGYCRTRHGHGHGNSKDYLYILVFQVSMQTHSCCLGNLIKGYMEHGDSGQNNSSLLLDSRLCTLFSAHCLHVNTKTGSSLQNNLHTILHESQTQMYIVLPPLHVLLPRIPANMLVFSSLNCKCSPTPEPKIFFSGPRSAQEL